MAGRGKAGRAWQGVARRGKAWQGVAWTPHLTFGGAMSTQQQVEIRAFVPLGEEERYIPIGDARNDPQLRAEAIAVLQEELGQLKSDVVLIRRTLRYLEVGS